MTPARMLFVAAGASTFGMLLPALSSLPPTCGKVSLWFQWQVTRQFLDVRMVVALFLWAISMILSMMAWGLTRPAGHVIAQSLPRRTASLLFIFVTAFVCTWLPLLAALCLVAAELQRYLINLPTALVGWGLWYAWTCTPLYQTAQNRCHQMMPLRSFGLAAAIDTTKFGISHGFWCALSCWPLMLLPLLWNSVDYIPMVACTVIATLARMAPARSVRWRPDGCVVPLCQTSKRAIRLLLTMRNPHRLSWRSPIV